MAATAATSFVRRLPGGIGSAASYCASDRRRPWGESGRCRPRVPGDHGFVRWGGRGDSREGEELTAVEEGRAEVVVLRHGRRRRGSAPSLVMGMLTGRRWGAFLGKLLRLTRP